MSNISETITEQPEPICSEDSECQSNPDCANLEDGYCECEDSKCVIRQGIFLYTLKLCNFGSIFA